jgi:hypothetical protein
MKRNGSLTATGVALALLWPVAAAYGQQVRAPKRNPLVRVVTISQDGATKDESGSLLGAAMERLNQAASLRPWRSSSGPRKPTMATETPGRPHT